MGDLTRDFSISEFHCKDPKRTPIPAKYKENVKRLARNLQVLRDKLDRPIQITSGYRTLAWNRKHGGASNSQHLYAAAADLIVEGMSSVAVIAEIEALIKAGKMLEGGIGVYTGWVHYDVRGARARWNGG